MSQQWEIAHDKEFDEFRKKCDDEEGWEEVWKDGTTRVTKKKTNDTIYPVRVSTVYPNLEPEVIYDTLHDHEYRPVWDQNMIEGKVIELLDDRNEIGYYSAKCPTPIYNRDFVNLRSWRAEKEKGEWIIMNHSVKHPQWPENKNFVRAISIMTGYLTLRNPGGGSRFLYYSQSDPQGWIPSFAINSLMTTVAPKLVDKLRDAALLYPAWKAQHNPDHKPWLK